VTLGQAGIGDGLTCPLFSGASFNNIYSPGFAAAFNPARGSLLMWSKVFNAGVWTDGAYRRLWKIGTDGNNAIDVYKSITNNTLVFNRIAGGISDLVSTTVMGGNVNWFSTVLTWDTVTDELKVYINGAQVGATQTTLGTWVGALNNTLCAIGANGTGGSQPWYGYHAHGIVLNYVATDSEIAQWNVISGAGLPVNVPLIVDQVSYDFAPADFKMDVSARRWIS